MRVCMFSMMLPAHVTGGMEVHALDLAKGEAAAGHDVTLITCRHPDGADYDEVEGVKIHYADVEATSRKPMGKAAIEKFVQLHKEKRFDVIHSQSIAALNYLTGGWKEDLKVPFVATIHGTNMGEIRSNLNQGLTPMLIPKIAYQLWCHQFRSKPLLEKSDRIISISEELTAALLREYNLPQSKVRTVYNGIDTKKFAPTKGRKTEGGKMILSVSVLHKQKGVQNLIAAFKKISDKVPDAKLTIVGDGPYRSELAKQARRLGVGDRVTFTGRVMNNRTPEYYNSCDVFVIPTVRVEGLPLIELEAMSCGRPVVASNIGGIPTVIKNGENGVLVKPGDVDELASEVVNVLQDERLSAKLGTAARKTIEERFSREKMVANTLAVYKEAAG